MIQQASHFLKGIMDISKYIMYFQIISEELLVN